MKIVTVLVSLWLAVPACALDQNDDLVQADDTEAIITSAEIAPQTIVIDKKTWGTAGTDYDHSFFVIGTTDTPVQGSRQVKTDPADGHTYQAQYITSSTGWGDLSLIHAHIPASPGQWWTNMITAKIGTNSDIYVEGKIYFINSANHVLYECVSVTQSTSWANGTLQTWNKAPGLVPEVNVAQSACRAPPGTVVMWAHIKTTAKHAGQTGVGMVKRWRVARCADDGTCWARANPYGAEASPAGSDTDEPQALAE
jgi:hypothetical protein